MGVGLDIVNTASQNLCFNDKQPKKIETLNMNLVQIESLNFKKCLGIVNTASQNLCFNDKQRENPPPSESICWQAHLR